MPDEEGFPLELLLAMYEKDTTGFFVDYMEGFKLLVDWLRPIKLPTLYIETMPSFVGNGACRMAQIIGCDWRLVQQVGMEMMTKKQEIK